MEEKAASANNQVANKGDEEDLVVSVFQTIVYSPKSQPDKEKVGQGVDYLGRVDGGIVILLSVNLMVQDLNTDMTNLLAPVKCRSDGAPKPVSRRRIRH